MFYKLERKGEEIHCEMNELNRKAWCIKKKSERLWTLVYRYEMKNQSTDKIVKPVKRIFKDPKRNNKE